MIYLSSAVLVPDLDTPSDPEAGPLFRYAWGLEDREGCRRGRSTYLWTLIQRCQSFRCHNHLHVDAELTNLGLEVCRMMTGNGLRTWLSGFLEDALVLPGLWLPICKHCFSVLCSVKKHLTRLSLLILKAPYNHFYFL